LVFDEKNREEEVFGIVFALVLMFAVPNLLIMPWHLIAILSKLT